MQKPTYPPEKITVKVQNHSQPASKKSVFQRLGGKSSKLSLEEQCKELRRQIKMEGGSGGGSAKKRAVKRHKESSSSSESSSGSSSDSSSSSSSSQSSPTSHRRSKKTKKPSHHHSSSSVDHLAAKIRKTSSSTHARPTTTSSSSSVKPSSSSSTTAAAAKLLLKKHKSSSRLLESPPPPSSRRRSVTPPSPRSSRKHHELKKRSSGDHHHHHHRSKEASSSSRSTSDRLHDLRGRSRSPRSSSTTTKRRLSPPETSSGKRHSSGSRSLPRRSDRSSLERERERDRERREKDRDMARNKEREEALMRCQERQRERERVAREQQQRKEERSREKSVEKGRLQHVADRRAASRGRELLHEAGRSRGYDRRSSPTAIGDSAYDVPYERPSGDSYSRSRSATRSSVPVYEKDYGMRGGGGGRERSPYEEVSTLSRGGDKYRGSEYEGRSSVVYGGGGGGGRNEWEEEKHGKGILPPSSRERIIGESGGRTKDWGPSGSGGGGGGSYRSAATAEGKEWSSTGERNKWEGQKFSQSGGGREEMWRGEAQGGKVESAWRGAGASSSAFAADDGGGSWKESHGPGSGFGYGSSHHHHTVSSAAAAQGPSSGGGGPPSGPRIMGPRYDSWHSHKPRFTAKKEFYPRHQFPAGGGGAAHDGGAATAGETSTARYPGQQPKRFGEYQSSFGPRGMNQGPKFSAPVHAQSLHSSGGQAGGHSSSTGAAVEATSPAKATAITNSGTASAKIEDVGTPTEDEKKTGGGGAATAGAVADDLVEGDNLSEFSDDGDEILDKNDEELRMRQSQQAEEGQSTMEVEATMGDVVEGDGEEGKKEKVSTAERGEGGAVGGVEDADQDDLTLDFEEISDGELEDDGTKMKGLGDALGVDWASLVVTENKDELMRRSTADNLGEVKATVKEMWEPRRIFRDVGISVRMAGRELAERLLGKEPLAEEHTKRIKVEPKGEENGTGEGEKEGEIAVVKADPETPDEVVDLSKYPMASCQVAWRKRREWRANLILNRNAGARGGINPVALYARKDLEIRRQLCGLPAREIQVDGRVDEQLQKELKGLAMELFAKATAVQAVC